MLPTIPSDWLQQLSAATHEQQLWLSGYLYGLATGQQTDREPVIGTAESALVSEPAPRSTRDTVRILYGSQTGNSKKVAFHSAEHLRNAGWEVQVSDMNDYPTKLLKEEKVLLVAVSTQGEGDPPITAETFYHWLRGNRAPKLPGLKYSVLALGDKTYLQFCQTGKDFDAQLESLGATRLSPRVDCDVDYEASVTQWLDTVLAQLEALSPAVVSPAQTGNTAYVRAHANGISAPAALQTAIQPVATPQYSRKKPFAAPLLEKIQLNGRGSSKETWHLEFSLEGSGLAYEPGDALGIFAQNPASLVNEVLYTAMLNGNKPLTFNGREDTFRNILLQEVEITMLTREVVENYANWTNNATLKAVLQDQAAFKQFLWGRNLADLLREFPAAMSEATLLGFLRKLPPRLYSIASCLESHPEEVHLTVAAVRYQHNGRPHLGAASTYLADRVQLNDTVPVFLEQNEYFKVPTDDNTDIIMVGPGTGVAPFRAFVEARSERGAKGKNWLFFGNPHFETDFLYQTEWLNHLKQGSLDRLDVAFSRDQSEKIYVQHRLMERSRLIYERLENGAHFYVCGDKNKMAADVQEALIGIVEKESGKERDFAVEYLKNLKKQRRYLEDVY